MGLFRCRRGVVLLAFSLALPALGQGTSLKLAGGELSYTLTHKLHEVKGVSHEAEGRAVRRDAGVLVQVRARVASFESGNGNRDVHMREVTHEPSHPFVELKGMVADVPWPLEGPVERPVQASVQLNGVTERITFPVTLRPEEGGVRAIFSFPISLQRFQIETPSLLLVKADDAVRIEGSLSFRAEP